MEKGAIDFIEKPLSDEVVIESIGKAANRAAQRGQSDAALKTVASSSASATVRSKSILPA
jgi:two-component system response regulator FixJ